MANLDAPTRNKRWWYILLAAIVVAIAWWFKLPRRVVITYSAARYCAGCSPGKRAADSAHAFTMDPDLAEQVIVKPMMTGSRTAFYYEFPTVGVLLLDGGLKCTGTLVGSDVVLTAAHCVAGIDRRRMTFGFGPDIVSARKKTYSIRDVQYPTGFPDVRFKYDPITYADDVAIVYLLQRPGTNRSRLATVTPTLPMTLPFVGYGFDLLGSSGVRSTADLLVTLVSARRIKHGDAVRSVCTGDSGGPAFDVDGAVLAVTSTTQGCAGGESTLVPALYPWLHPRIPE